ncbi:MAG: NADP-dependent oxidoreductase [Myxococcota bacterium]
MKAARVKKFGTLTLDDIPEPEPKAGELQVRVHASSVNPVDLETLSGDNKPMMPVKRPFVLGVDVAGVVSKVGDGVSGFAEGDRVVGYTGVPRPGAFAEVVCHPAQIFAKLPDAVSFEDAAVLALAGLAAKQLLDRLELGPGDSVLIIGAAGAVGTAAVQIAKDRDYAVTVSVHSRDAERMEALGVEKVFSYDQEPFRRSDKRYTGVVDLVGSDALSEAYNRLNDEGRVATAKGVPTIGELKRAGFKVGFFTGRALVTARTFLRPPGGIPQYAIVAGPDAAGLTELMDKVAEGRLKATVAHTVSLDELPETVARIKKRELSGKVLVSFT